MRTAKPLAQVSIALFIAAMSAAVLVAQSPNTPVVTSATVSADQSTLFISGANFGAAPTVTLGGVQVGGVVVDVTGHQIAAVMPSLPPATHLLQVFNANKVGTLGVAVGLSGPKGDQGDPGPIGPTGADGLMGPVGPSGADGAAGAVGPAGPAGADGTNGTNGTNGAPGAAGPAGPAGANGAIGPTGPAGAAGSMGLPGPTGPIGPTGPAGPSATQACSLCFTCGGSWPNFSGDFQLADGANNLERGSACSGSLTLRSDSLPQLCCK